MSEITAEILDEFNLLDTEINNSNEGSIYIGVEDIGEDTAITFGHTNLSKIEVINLLAYVYEQYIASLGECTCGECDEDEE